jgi:murein DD-endopeptidase MepM/ murein hydrolase activator NlpD
VNRRFKIQDLGFRNGIFVIILASLILNPISARAASTAALSQQIEEVKAQRNALLEEQARLEAELDKITAEGQSLGTAVKGLDATRAKLAADIKVTQSKIKSADLNIKVLENGVSEKEQEIADHRKAISEALKQLSDADKRPVELDILSSTNFSELWADMSELSSLSGTLQTEVDRLRATRSALIQQKTDKEKAKAQALALSTELTGQKQVVEETKSAKEKLLAETKSKEAEYQALLAENRAQQKQFEDDLFRLESQLNLAIDPTKVIAARHGVLAWPLDKIYVTTYFGTVTTSAEKRIYASGSHNGVDFRASQGTAVKAMGQGTVTATGNTDEQKGCGSYGRWLLISYPNGLSSIYGHLSATLVKAGDTVAPGQVVAYSGGTPGVFGSGYSTGPHLHVGLFATQGVEVRQFVESRGCKQVIVPIADVKAYLDPLAYLPKL